METFLLAEALKAQQWERAKGELRALVALQGSYSTSESIDGTSQWELLEREVDRFITVVESDGLVE